MIITFRIRITRGGRSNDAMYDLSRKFVFICFGIMDATADDIAGTI